MTIEMTYVYDDDVNRRICIVYEYITEIRVFVHYSNTARGYNLDIHWGYR